MKKGKSPDLVILTKASEVKLARKRVKDCITRGAEKLKLKLGHQGDTWSETAYYLPKLDLWTAFANADTELWNTYGLGDPTENTHRSMICHLSVPSEGTNRRIGAVYARSGKTGKLYVLHREFGAVVIDDDDRSAMSGIARSRT